MQFESEAFDCFFSKRSLYSFVCGVFLRRVYLIAIPRQAKRSRSERSPHSDAQLSFEQYSPEGRTMFTSDERSFLPSESDRIESVNQKGLLTYRDSSVPPGKTDCDESEDDIASDGSEHDHAEDLQPVAEAKHPARCACFSLAIPILPRSSVPS